MWPWGPRNLQTTQCWKISKSLEKWWDSKREWHKHGVGLCKRAEKDKFLYILKRKCGYQHLQPDSDQTNWFNLLTPSGHTQCGHPGCEISNKACAFVDFNHWRDKGKCISDKVIYRSKGLLGNWRSARQFYCIQSDDFGLLPIWIWIYIYTYFFTSFSCVFPYMLPHTCTQELIISHWDVSLRAEWLP